MQRAPTRPRLARPHPAALLLPLLLACRDAPDKDPPVDSDPPADTDQPVDSDPAAPSPTRADLPGGGGIVRGGRITAVVTVGGPVTSHGTSGDRLHATVGIGTFQQHP